MTIQITELEESSAVASVQKQRRRGSVPHLWSEASVETATAELPSRICTPHEELLSPETTGLAYGRPPPVPPKPHRNPEATVASSTRSQRHISTTSRQITSTTTKKTYRSEAYLNCKCTE